MLYVLDRIPKGEATVEVVTSQGFAELLSDGWEVVTQADNRQIPWKPANQKVLGERVILRRREENRGVAVAGHERAESTLTLHDEYGRPRQVSSDVMLAETLRTLAQQNAQQSHGGGHLGVPAKHLLPGTTIISGDIVGKAEDAGMAAAKAGDNTNPFPPGHPAHRLWNRGHSEGRKLHGAGPGELQAAYHHGEQTARTAGLVEVVTCPFLADDLRKEWERGYADSGGTIVGG